MMRRPSLLALSASCALWLAACADPSEVRQLRASKAMLEAELATQRQILADEALYRQAMKDAPLAGLAVDPPEVTARVSRAAVGVAVSVERDPGGGLNVSFSGPAAPPRAAVALVQIAAHLPDLSLSQASLGPEGFSARGVVAGRGPPEVAVPSGEGARASLAAVRTLRAEVESLERQAAEMRAKVSPEMAQRGPAAVAAMTSPDRFRQQAALLQALVAGAPPLASSADVTFDAALITARGALTPGRAVMDALPLFKQDYELQAIRADAGRFELKLAPRATAR